MSAFHPHVHGMVAVPLGITFVFQAAKKKAGKGKKSVPAESDTFYQKRSSFSRRPAPQIWILSYWAELCHMATPS